MQETLRFVKRINAETLRFVKRILCLEKKAFSFVAGNLFMTVSF